MGRSLKEFGGSCILPKAHKRRDTDYDGYNDFNEFVTESGWED